MKLLNEIPDYLVPDSIRDSIGIAIPQPTKWQRIADEIDTAFIFALADFVNVQFAPSR